MKNFTIAIIGGGLRGRALYRQTIRTRENVNVAAICDTDKEKCEKFSKEMVEEWKKPAPKLYCDYKQCIDEIHPDAILVSTAWEAHIEISIYAMEKGIPVACEVGGAYTIESLWDIVKCYERTKTPIMMMENCCYGRMELLALSMKRKGLLGKIVHCAGAYRHDLREEVTSGEKLKHYRLLQYMMRNTENYPTHEIGPIAKLLDINCGNRFESLTAMGSAAVGIEEYVKEKNIQSLQNVKFRQSDVFSTLIKCAGGETIALTLDTCLPRYYSRSFLVEGTKGLICEENQSVYLDEEFDEEIWDWSNHFNNVSSYYEKYDHFLWKDFRPGKEDGHGGMDILVFNAFFEALENNQPMPIDVYDMASWMSISVLAEQAALTGQRVYFPDFTNGKWITRKNQFALEKE